MALGEVCTLSVLIYVLSTDPEIDEWDVSLVKDYASVVDDLFEKSFPYATDFAISLFKQKLAGDARDRRREEEGKLGGWMWSISMVLAAALSALRDQQSPLKPLPERFPLFDSRSLEQAGVPSPPGVGQDPRALIGCLSLVTHGAVSALRSWRQNMESDYDSGGE